MPIGEIMFRHSLMRSASVLAVTGISGRLGQQVIRLLLERASWPPHRLIATTRTPERHASLSSAGVSVRLADFDDPATLSDAFAGAERLLLISTDTVDGSGRRVMQHRHAIEAARRAGVRHIVYTSLLHAEDARPSPVTADHVATERLLAESGIDHTILRHAFYHDMLFAVLGDAAISGRFLSAANTGRVPYVAREDCALVASAVLCDSFDGTRTLEVTGPEALDADCLAQIATSVFGRPIHVIAVDVQQRTHTLMERGTPPAMAYALAAIDGWIGTQAMDVVSDCVQRLTGRQPTSVADFLRAHAQRFRVPIPS